MSSVSSAPEDDMTLHLWQEEIARLNVQRSALDARIDRLEHLVFRRTQFLHEDAKR